MITKLKELLFNHAGNGFAHIKTKTVPVMRKTNNPFFGKVFKITDANIQAGFHYINSVNNQLEREGKKRNANLKPRKWGVRIGGTPLVEHTNKKGDHNLYLEAKVENVNSSYFVDGDGNQVDREELAPFLYASKKSSTQGNVEREVFLRDYKLDSIQWIKMDGVELEDQLEETPNPELPTEKEAEFNEEHFQRVVDSVIDSVNLVNSVVKSND
jgi:hypothetical protein